MSEIKDFSRPRDRIAFTIDDDEFEAAPAIPAELLAELVERYSGAGETEGAKEQYEILIGALELILLPTSFARIKERVRDREHPVDLDQIDDIITWLIERYGLRPTQPSQDSSDGPASPEPGTSSTVTTPVEESTSPPSLPIAS